MDVDLLQLFLRGSKPQQKTCLEKFLLEFQRDPINKGFVRNFHRSGVPGYLIRKFDELETDHSATAVLHIDVVIYMFMNATRVDYQHLMELSTSFIPQLIHLIRDAPTSDIQDRILLLVGNIALDVGKYGGQLLDAGVLENVMALGFASTHTTAVELRIVSLLLNLSANNIIDCALYDVLSDQLLSFLSQFLTSIYEELRSCACQVLGELSNRSINGSDFFACGGLVERLVYMVEESPHAWRVLFNICKWSSMDVFESNVGLIVMITSLLPVVAISDSEQRVLEACELVSILCAGPSAVLQTVIDSGLIPIVIALKTTMPCIHSFVVHAMVNALHSCDHHQAYYLLQETACLDVLNDMLQAAPEALHSVGAVSMVQLVLSSIDAILYSAPMELVYFDIVAHNLETAGVWESVTVLRQETVTAPIRILAIDLDRDSMRTTLIANELMQDYTDSSDGVLSDAESSV